MVVVAVLKSSLKVVVGNVTPESIINSAIKWGQYSMGLVRETIYLI